LRHVLVRTCSVTVLLGGAALAGGLVLTADVVTTSQGVVLEGVTTRATTGELVVATVDGEVRLAPGDVRSVVEGEGPRTRVAHALAGFAKDDAEGPYRLALGLEAQGRTDLARRAYEAVLAAEPDHPAARRALGFEKVDGAWMSVAQARRRNGLVLFEDRWVLPAELDRATKTRRTARVSDAALASAMKAAATSKGALARSATLQVEQASPAQRLATATSLLVHRDPRVRGYACLELGRLGDAEALRSLIAVAVRDTNATVRADAVQAVASFGRDDAAIPFVRALWSEHPGIVASAAQALSTLHDPRSVRYLVRRISSHGSSPGAYFAHVEEQAYVRDFDVEVAQTSFIADPVIGTLQQGEVQDVKVLDASIEQTEIVTVLVGAFNSIAGTHFETAEQVASWAKDHMASLPDFVKADAPAPGGLR